jgi:hypothetical protein
MDRKRRGWIIWKDRDDGIGVRDGGRWMRRKKGDECKTCCMINNDVKH